jgi:hypothetical protein
LCYHRTSLSEKLILQPGLNFTRMAREAKAQTVEQAVDYFARRFLLASLNEERRGA